MRTGKLRLYSAVGPFVFLMASLAVSNGFAADGYGKFCTTWNTVYEDAGKGEDYLTSNEAFYRATYSRYGLQYYDSEAAKWENIWGYLDSNGCTPYRWLKPNTTYYFHQGTQVQSPTGNRTILVNPDGGSTFDMQIVWMTSIMATLSAPPGSPSNPVVVEFAENHIPLSSKGNIMPIAARVMLSSTQNGYPEGLLTAIKTDRRPEGPCYDDGAYYQEYSGGKGVCVNADSAMGWGDITQWKFIVALD